MTTIDDYKQIAIDYLKEACDKLSICDGVIRILFVPYLPTVQGIPQFSIYNSKERTIFVSENWIKSLMEKNGVTPLRRDIYCKARYAYQHIKNGNIEPDYDDGQDFSLALMALKGLQLPLPATVSPDAYFRGILDILHKEFGLDCELEEVPEVQLTQIKYYYLRMTKEEEERQNWGCSFASKVVVKEKLLTHTGTKTDPFDNIDDAIEHIQNMEHEFYDNDTVMQGIASAHYYYDFVFHQFRYPFASPLIAFCKNNFPDNCFIVNQSINPNGYFDFTLKPNLYGRKFLFRGQNEDYSPKPCVPNLFRDSGKNYFLDDYIWSQEMELLLMSHPLVRLLYNGVELVHDFFRFNMNLGGLAQHYYHKTSFLDLTSSIDVAKFFAVTDYCRTKDEYYPVSHEDRLGVIYCYELRFPSPFQRHADGHHLSVIGKQVFMRSGAQHGFLLDMPKGLDMKTLPEVKPIYFRHNMAKSVDIFKKADNGKQFFAIDLLEKVWKEEYLQRKDQGVVSADTVRLNVSRNKGETFDSICRKLNDFGIMIDDSYTPHFTDKMLDEYYSDIKNGWWDDFCKDIFFYGADGILYKDALRNLPMDRRYKEYFFGSVI
jgi:hypothetical protein